MLMKSLLEPPNIKYESNKQFWAQFTYSLGHYLQLNQGNLLISDVIDYHKQTCITSAEEILWYYSSPLYLLSSSKDWKPISLSTKL